MAYNPGRGTATIDSLKQKQRYHFFTYIACLSEAHDLLFDEEAPTLKEKVEPGTLYDVMEWNHTTKASKILIRQASRYIYYYIKACEKDPYGPTITNITYCQLSETYLKILRANKDICFKKLHPYF